MKHSLRIAFALLLVPLAGCDSLQETWGRYRHLPAGQDAAIWRPAMISEADFDAQTAHPADLSSGSIATSTTAKPMADAVDRMMTGHVNALPASSIAKFGQSGQGSPASGGQ